MAEHEQKKGVEIVVHENPHQSRVLVDGLDISEHTRRIVIDIEADEPFTKVMLELVVPNGEISGILTNKAR
jgi:hypothetical protein